MRKLISGIFIVASLFIIASCTQIVDSGEGEVSIGLPFIDGGSNTQRAAAGEEDITSSLTFYFTLTHANGDVISKSGKSGETIQLEFKPGEITAEAIAVSTKIEDEIAKLEKQDFATVLDYVKKSGKAYFTGSGKATVEAGKTAELNISFGTIQFKLSANYIYGSNSREITSEIPKQNGTVTIKATPKSASKFKEGTKFIWKINGKEVTGENKETLSFVPATTPYALNFEAQNEITCESYIGKIKETASLKFTLVDRLFTDPGIILWNAQDTEDVLNLTLKETDSLESLKLGIQVFDEISADQEITSSLINGLNNWYNVKCFCIDPKTGDVYIAVGPSDKSYIYRYDSTSPGEKLTKIATDIDFNPTSIVYLDNKLYMLKVSYYDTGAGTSEYISTSSLGILNNLSSTPEFISVTDLGPYKVNDGHKLVAMTTDGKGLYTISTDNGYWSINRVADTSKGITYSKSDFLWYINTNKELRYINLTGRDNFALTSDAEKNYFKVTDMQANNGNIYVLITESNTSANRIRGGVLKITIDDFKKVAFDNGEHVLGWYNGETIGGNTIINPLNAIKNEGAELKTNVFYHPTKFVALKPDVLVIADESAVLYEGVTRNTNRIVTVDLSTGTLSGVNVKASLGKKYNNGCGFTNY